MKPILKWSCLLMVVAALSGTASAQGTYHQPVPPAPRSNADQISLAPPTYSPGYFVTVGGGDQTPGPGAGFAYWSVSKYLGQQNYVTAITEYSMTKGQVVTCPLAGVSHVLTSLGPISVGLVGAGGACSGSIGGATSAASAQGFVVFHIGGSWSIVATARKTFVPNTTQDAVRLTLGIGYGK